MDARAIPFADESFDVVMANHMLYHVPERARAFAEIRRVLQPAGCLYAATNGEQHLRELDELVRSALPGVDTRDLSMQASEFTLENAPAQLARHFSNVRVVPHENALRVTEVEPLVAYVLSSPVGQALRADQVEELRRAIAARLGERGYIHIGKAVGVFEARA